MLPYEETVDRSGAHGASIGVHRARGPYLPDVRDTAALEREAIAASDPSVEVLRTGTPSAAGAVPSAPTVPLEAHVSRKAAAREAEQQQAAARAAELVAVAEGAKAEARREIRAELEAAREAEAAAAAAEAAEAAAQEEADRALQERLLGAKASEAAEQLRHLRQGLGFRQWRRGVEAKRRLERIATKVGGLISSVGGEAFRAQLGAYRTWCAHANEERSRRERMAQVARRLLPRAAAFEAWRRAVEPPPPPPPPPSFRLLPGGSAVAERPSDAATVQSGMRRVAELGAQLDPQGTQALVRDLAGFGQALLEAMAQPEALPNRWGTQLPLRRTAAEALAQLPDTMGAHEAAQVGDTSDKSDEMRTAPPPLAKPSLVSLSEHQSARAAEAALEAATAAQQEQRVAAALAAREAAAAAEQRVLLDERGGDRAQLCD